MSRHNSLWCELVRAQWEWWRRWHSLICCHLHICNAVRLTGFPWCLVSGSSGVGFLQCVKQVAVNQSPLGFSCQLLCSVCCRVQAPEVKRLNFNMQCKVLSPSCLHKPAQSEVWRHGHWARSTWLHSVPWGGKASRESWGVAPHPAGAVGLWH